MDQGALQHEEAAEAKGQGLVRRGNAEPCPGRGSAHQRCAAEPGPKNRSMESRIMDPRPAAHHLIGLRAAQARSCFVVVGSAHNHGSGAKLYRQ